MFKFSEQVVGGKWDDYLGWPSYEMMACLLILHRTEDAEQIDDHLMNKF